MCTQATTTGISMPSVARLGALDGWSEMLRVEFLAKFPPAFWRKARASDHLVMDWGFDSLSVDSGYLSCVLRYDTPSGVALFALNRADVNRYVQVDKSLLDRFGYLAWESAICAAAEEIMAEIGLYVMLCDIEIFGSPFNSFTVGVDAAAKIE